MAFATGTGTTILATATVNAFMTLRITSHEPPRESLGNCACSTEFVPETDCITLV